MGMFGFFMRFSMIDQAEHYSRELWSPVFTMVTCTITSSRVPVSDHIII